MVTLITRSSSTISYHCNRDLPGSPFGSHHGVYDGLAGQQFIIAAEHPAVNIAGLQIDGVSGYIRSLAEVNLRYNTLDFADCALLPSDQALIRTH